MPPLNLSKIVNTPEDALLFAVVCIIFVVSDFVINPKFQKTSELELCKELRDMLDRLVECVHGDILLAGERQRYAKNVFTEYHQKHMRADIVIKLYPPRGRVVVYVEVKFTKHFRQDFIDDAFTRFEDVIQEGVDSHCMAMHLWVERLRVGGGRRARVDMLPSDTDVRMDALKAVVGTEWLGRVESRTFTVDRMAGLHIMRNVDRYLRNVTDRDKYTEYKRRFMRDWDMDSGYVKKSVSEYSQDLFGGDEVGGGASGGDATFIDSSSSVIDPCASKDMLPMFQASLTGRNAMLPIPKALAPTCVPRAPSAACKTTPSALGAPSTACKTTPSALGAPSAACKTTPSAFDLPQPFACKSKLPGKRVAKRARQKGPLKKRDYQRVITDMTEDDKVYEVEHIVAGIERDGAKSVTVKWKGYEETTQEVLTIRSMCPLVRFECYCKDLLDFVTGEDVDLYRLECEEWGTKYINDLYLDILREIIDEVCEERKYGQESPNSVIFVSEEKCNVDEEEGEEESLDYIPSSHPSQDGSQP